MLATRELFDGLYALEDERVRQFLVLGAERALLFDAGFADSGVLETVRSLTDQPIDVVMTHGDRDHSGGLVDFGCCRMHEGDWPLVAEMDVALSPLAEGEVLACGGYRFRVIAIPGHTPGSLAFYDEEKGILLSGDTVQSGGPIYMFGPKRDLTGYIASLEKLERMIPASVTAVPQCLPDRRKLHRAGSGGCTGAARRQAAERGAFVAAVSGVSWCGGGLSVRWGHSLKNLHAVRPFSMV